MILKFLKNTGLFCKISLNLGLFNASSWLDRFRLYLFGRNTAEMIFQYDSQIPILFSEVQSITVTSASHMICGA